MTTANDFIRHQSLCHLYQMYHYSDQEYAAD